MNLYGEYAVVFGVALVSSFLIGFPIRKIALAVGAVDQPDGERVHASPVPNLGGAAMLLGFGIAFFVASQLHQFAAVFHGSTEPLGVGLAALIIFGVGLIDDIRDISPPAKVAGQVLAAMVLVFLGATMEYFKVPFFPTIYVLSPSILPLITAIWVVGVANAVNLIDGLDGLAAGIVAVASAALCIYGLRLESFGNLTPDNVGPLVAAVTCGVCLGFLPHNFYPARIFMGDSGALFLGLLMAAATMVIGGRTAANGAGATDVTGLTFFRFAPLFIPFFILGVPILDTVFAVVRRTIRGASFAERDLGHLHHRLVRLGHGHRRSVLILWSWTALLSTFALLPLFVARANAYVPFVVVALLVLLYTAFLPGRRGAAGVAGPEPVASVARATSTAASASPLSVVMSTAAGVAVAGESDLASPRRRRRRHRIVHLPRRRATDVPRPISPEGPRAAAPEAHTPRGFAGSDEGMRG